jgi:malic enzyme
VPDHQPTNKNRGSYRRNSILLRSPTPSTTSDDQQPTHRFIFPGLGLGAVVSGAAIITDKMLYASSEALAASLTEEERGEGRVFPRVRRIREVAVAVVSE